MGRFSHERRPHGLGGRPIVYRPQEDLAGASGASRPPRTGRHYATREPKAKGVFETTPTPHDTSFEPQTVSQHAQKTTPVAASPDGAHRGARTYNPAEHRAAPRWVRSILPHVPQGATVTKSWDILSPETVARLSRRRKGRRILIACVLAGALVLLGVGVYLYQRNLSGHAALDQSLDLVQEADITVVALDQSIDANVTADTVDSLTGLVAQRDDATSKLDQARDLAAQAQGSLVRSSERDIASEALMGIDARVDMLTGGTQILQDGIDAYQAAALFSQAWDLIIDANSNIRSSVSDASSSTSATQAAAAESARATATTAADDLTKAKGLIDQAQSTYQAADFSALLAYVSAKQGAVTAQLAVDDALAQGDATSLASAVDAYNAADAAAVQAATALPSDPTTIVTDAYASQVDSLHTDYLSARERAAASDVYIRDYLGTSSNESTESS